MKTKVSVENMRKLEKLLEKINGKAHAHCFTAASLIDAAYDAEARLASLELPKRERKGAMFSLYSRGKLPTSYKYSTAANVLTIKRGCNEWFIHELRKVGRWPNEGEERRLFLKPAQVGKVVCSFIERNNIEGY